MPGFLSNAIAAAYVPSSDLASTLGFSLRQLITGTSATTQRTKPKRNALDVDLGSVPSEPATSAATRGPTKWPREALKV